MVVTLFSDWVFFLYLKVIFQGEPSYPPDPAQHHHLQEAFHYPICQSDVVPLSLVANYQGSRHFTARVFLCHVHGQSSLLDRGSQHKSSTEVVPRGSETEPRSLLPPVQEADHQGCDHILDPTQQGVDS